MLAPDRTPADPLPIVAVGHDRIGRFFPVLLGLTLLAAVLEAAGAALLHSAPIGRASISTAVFAMSVLIAGYHIRTGRPFRARIVLAISLTVFGALGGFLVPVGNASALLPVVSFILVLPHTSRRWLVAVAAITLGSTVLILLMDAAFSPAVVPSDFVLATFRDGIIVGVVILVLAGLADFAMVSRDSLRDLHDSTTRQLRVTTSRLSLVAALRKVRRRPRPRRRQAPSRPPWPTCRW